MGFWRSLRRWWSWDGSPDTDPFRNRESGAVADEEGAVSGHAHAAAEPEPEEQSGDED